jgi:tRNA(Ile)-lysidine synthase
VRRPIAASDPRIGRFRADLEALTGAPPSESAPLAIAVSGGPDSTALLLLAAAAYPGQLRAATVDHRLRPEGADEARQVAQLCAQLGVPHDILAIAWPDPPAANLQAQAREARYRLLTRWAGEHRCRWLAVAHHIDDQAETLLMRLGRGAGIGGAAGARLNRPLSGDPEQTPIRLVRPLLGWRRAELAALVAESGAEPVDDPANRDVRYDRSRARRLLADTPWLLPDRLAAAAAHFAEADEALGWAADRLWEERAEREEDGVLWLDPAGLPAELQRRLLTRVIGLIAGGGSPPGPKLARVLAGLREGRGATIAGVKCAAGARWRFSRAPARRSG